MAMARAREKCDGETGPTERSRSKKKNNDEALTANASVGDVCALGTKRGSHACFGMGAREITTSW